MAEAMPSAWRWLSSMPAPARYGAAIVAVGAAWLLRTLVLTEAIDRSPFLAFGLAVLASALIGGFGPGLLAMILSCAIAVFFYLPPELALAVHDPFDGVQLVFFIAEGLVAATAGGLVRLTASGRPSPAPVDRLARVLERAERARGGTRPAAGLPEPLTERELEVARLLVMGHSNEEIAAAMFVSVNTVKTHLKNLYGKLAVRSRTEAVARCIELQLLSGPEGAGAAEPGRTEPAERGSAEPR
jgi:DNA-binding CsgD family transcriptional regulator